MGRFKPRKPLPVGSGGSRWKSVGVTAAKTGVVVGGIAAGGPLLAKGITVVSDAGNKAFRDFGQTAGETAYNVFGGLGAGAGEGFRGAASGIGAGFQDLLLPILVLVGVYVVSKKVK